MTRIIKCCLLPAVLGLCLFGGMAQAQDTSPYLAGFWSESSNSFQIVNPTTKPLTVYAIFYNAYGGPYSGTECHKQYLPANGRVSIQSKGTKDYEFGAAKFFAFPAGTKKFDPNAVIGGFKQEIDCDYVMTGAYTQTGPSGDELIFTYSWIDRVREANIKAVTINSSTIGEFTDILKKVCPQYNGSYIRPKDYCEALPLPEPPEEM
jgi:hypothetical protein